jgi:hypothetical protein
VEIGASGFQYAVEIVYHSFGNRWFDITQTKKSIYVSVTEMLGY